MRTAVTTPTAAMPPSRNATTASATMNALSPVHIKANETWARRSGTRTTADELRRVVLFRATGPEPAAQSAQAPDPRTSRPRADDGALAVWAVPSELETKHADVPLVVALGRGRRNTPAASCLEHPT